MEEIIFCVSCKQDLPKNNFHNSTIRGKSNNKKCNICRNKIKKEKEMVENQKKYQCPSCNVYFPNGEGLIRYEYELSADCKTYILRGSRCNNCSKHMNNKKIIKTGGEIGHLPDMIMW
jgi:hypothetical protein